jgi:hypothetical protein
MEKTNLTDETSNMMYNKYIQISSPFQMKICTYETAGRKDLIRAYLDNLPKKESAEGYFILESLEREGILFLQNLDTRQLEGNYGK